MHNGVGKPTFGAIQRASIAVVIAAAIAFILPPSPVSAAISEYQVKAAFIYNFAKFVEWPERAFDDSDSPLVIGILGDDPFGSALENIVRGKSVNGRKLVIRHYRRVKEAAGSHILYVCPSEQRNVERILNELKDSPVLTVGETERFAQRGGMIGFVLENQRVGFEINLDAARRAGLKISCKLLKLAKLV